MSYYYVVAQYRDGYETPCGRPKQSLKDANTFACKVWSILGPISRRRIRLYVCGDLDGEIGFDSDRLKMIV